MQSILLKTVKKEELLLVISSHACKVSQYFQNHQKELWVLIIEKVWAKIHGSYKRVEAG